MNIMLRIDNQISLSRSSLTENSTYPPEIIELILKFARWLYEGEYYTQEDLVNLPLNVSRIFMLKLKLRFTSPKHTNFTGVGKVCVMRIKPGVSHPIAYIFHFAKFGKTYKLRNGRVLESDDNHPKMMMFNMLDCGTCVTIVILPCELEFKN